MGDMNLFCGGPVDGLAFPTRYLTSSCSFWLPIMDYKWSEETIVRNGVAANIWHWNYNHEPTKAEKWNGMEGPSLVEALWTELDASYHKFNNDNTITSEEVTRLKGYMRGIAWSLCVFMKPHFMTADSIVEECHRRYLHSLDPESTYCTPGLGVRRAEFPEGSKYSKTNIAPTVLKHDLDESTIAKIKGALAAGIGVDDLARMYDVKPDIIKSL